MSQRLPASFEAVLIIFKVSVFIRVGSRQTINYLAKKNSCSISYNTPMCIHNEPIRTFHLITTFTHSAHTHTWYLYLIIYCSDTLNP